MEDFPKKGIVFKDITPILNDPLLSEEIVNELIAMGHVTGREIIRNEGRSLFGRAQIIMRDPRNGVLRAGSDGRSDGMAQGY